MLTQLIDQLKEIKDELTQINQKMEQNQSYYADMLLYLVFLSRIVQGGADEDDTKFWQMIEKVFGIRPKQSSLKTYNKFA